MARKLTYKELEQTVNELEQDILAYKNAAKDAVKAKEELARIFNAVPDDLAVIDNQFKIQRVNKSLAEKLKCSTEGLMGKSCYRYICNADHPPASCPHAQLIGDGRVHNSELYNKKLEMNMRVTSSPLYNEGGRLVGGVHIIRDQL